MNLVNLVSNEQEQRRILPHRPVVPMCWLRKTVRRRTPDRLHLWTKQTHHPLRRANLNRRKNQKTRWGLLLLLHITLEAARARPRPGRKRSEARLWFVVQRAPT
ncbi:unnamed protein product [Amoebophrya sp. A120]|nr:unnamed protein product [Amoebophrya sp. A120]|eukprot:GSA120T00006817001.1